MTTANGTSDARIARKSLADQIDRLDGILDGLAEALNESIADAVKAVVGQVVKESVEASIRQVLASPDLLRAALDKHAPVAAMAPPTPSEPAPVRTGRLGGGVSRLWAWGIRKMARGCMRVGQAGRRMVAGCARAAHTAGGTLARLWQFRKPGAMALAVGILAGMGSYLAGPVIASVATGLGGAIMTVAGMILLPVWQLLHGSSGNEA